MVRDSALDWVVVASVPKGIRNKAINVSGNIFVPEHFHVHAELGLVHGDDEPFDAGLRVELQCQTLNGRDVYANAVKVVAPIEDQGFSVTGALLREIPVNRLAKWGLRLIAMERNEAGEWRRVIDETTGGRWTQRTLKAHGEVIDRPALNLWEIDAEIAATLEKTFGAAKTEKVGRRPARDEKFWRKIEAAYLEAIADGEPTIDAVHKAMGRYYSRGHVRNVITAARKRGNKLPKRGRVK